MTPVGEPERATSAPPQVEHLLTVLRGEMGRDDL